MKKVENIDILEGIIVGRVDPKIYAFTTGTVPNYLKVGDTYRPIETRLDEWRNYFPNLEKKFDHIAKLDDLTFFRDYAVHYFLEHEADRERLKKDEIKTIPYYSQEFFKGATKSDIENAVKDIERNYKNNQNKYQYYKFDESRVPITHMYQRTEDYKPRPNQKNTIEKFKKAIDSGGSNLLMYAVMRFGKSFTSMCCAVEMGAKIVLVVSAKADVKEEWKKTVESHKKFTDYVFLSNNDLLESKTVVKDKQKDGKKVVIFLTLQDLQGKEIKKKHKEIFENKIDLLIIDETHFGARAEEYGRVLRWGGLINKKNVRQELKLNDESFDDLDKEVKLLKARVRLHLSGTPYRILMGGEFKDDDIIAFYQFSDIAEDQKEWDQKNLYKDEVKEWDNPYYGFPQMVRFAFHPNESSRKKMEELKSQGISYALSALLKPQSIEKDTKNNLHKKFVHEAEVLDLFKVIDGSKNDTNILNFLDYERIKQGKMCRHIVCVLPYRASCDAFEALLKDNNFRNLSKYEIVNISGVESDKKYKTTQSVQFKIKDCESKNRKTITLTVNRMLTGSTVPEWDTMLYFKDTASPQEYDQAVFRLQNQYVRTYTETNGDTVRFNMKPQTLLVDFSPNRVFEVQEQKAIIYNTNIGKRGGAELKKQIQRELNISPIVVLNNNRIKEITPADILDAVRDYSKDRGVDDEARSIPIDIGLLNFPEIRAEIERQNEIGSKQGLEIEPTQGEGDDLDTGEIIEQEDNKEKTREDVTSINKEAEEDFRKKFATYYIRVLFFSFLTSSKVESVQDIVQVIKNNKDNQRIIKNLGINLVVLELFQKHVNPFTVVELDRKIHNINSLSNDIDIKPGERAKIAMKKFTRLSESEVVTPEFITDKMIDALPEKEIKLSTKILDIASKQGEFVYAVYKKFGKKVANNVYSIPTSKAAYEFTRRIYESLGLSIDNIEKRYTSYQLIEDNENINGKNVKMNNTNMKFDIIVGNPPYQESISSSSTNKSLSKQLFPDFIMTCIKLNPNYLSLITPSRWFTGDAQDKSFLKLREFFQDNNHISRIVNYLDGGDIFKGVTLTGGVNYFLFEKGFSGNVYFEEISNKKTDIIKRPLFEKGLDIVLPMNIMVTILKKVTGSNFSSMEDIVTGRNPFGVPATEADLEKVTSESKNSIRGVRVLCAYEKYRFIADKKITKRRELLNSWKVFTSKMNGGAGTLLDGKPVSILGRTYLSGPNTICSNAIISVGDFKQKYEAENLQKYMSSRFFRFMVGVMKVSQVLTSNVYRFVPQQDFTKKSEIDWSESISEIDKQLYKKYKLTKEEIEFIENNIKSME